MKELQNKALGPIISKTIVELNTDQMKLVKGGLCPLFSIGHACSIRSKCDRLWTKGWGDSNGDLPGGECGHEDILNAHG